MSQTGTPSLWNQSARILAMTAPALSGHNTALIEIDGVDEISKPFVFKIKFVTMAPATAVRGMLRTEATLEFGAPSQGGGASPSRRLVRGLVRRVTRTAVGEHGAGTSDWEAEVVAPLWFLSLKSDVRIYQNVTLGEIITSAMQSAGLPAPTINASGFASHKLEYCVQYNETTLDFISRLMEKFGWFYYYEHGASTSRLLISDTNGQVAAPDPVPLEFGASHGSASMVRLEEDYSVSPGNWTARDFDYKTFTHEERGHPTVLQSGGVLTSDERYGYPAAFPEKSKDPGQAGLYPPPMGSDLIKIVAERDEARHHLRHGASDAVAIDAGRRVKLDGSAIGPSEVLMVSVHHEAADYSHWTSEDAGRRRNNNGQPTVELFYRNSFTCLPQSVQFRPEARTPQPLVRGPQTATVTGSGEIDPDSLGRVKVNFHWDRNRQYTCWIRVSQGWAGNGFGHIQIPRVGEEVIVDFLEGNPDRPIITGRVYNGRNAVPYALPANKTQSGIKTRSSPGGGSSNFNELRFEDKKGEEHIFVHAERDLITEVENYETRIVGASATVPNAGALGAGDRHTGIQRNEEIKVGGNKTTNVTGNFGETIDGAETREVKQKVTETFRADEERTVLGKYTETVTGKYTITTSDKYSLTATTGIEMTSPVDVKITSTNQTIYLTAGVEIKQVSPKWFKTGSHAGDAYGVKIGVAGLKIDTASVSLGFVPVFKMDVVGMKVDISGIAYKNKPMEFSDVAAKIRKAFTLFDFSDLKIDF